MVAAAVVGAGVVGAVGTTIASGNAASAQESAANSANATQQQMFNTTQKNLSPYLQGGGAAENALLQLTGLGSPTTTSTSTPGTTSTTPGTPGATGGNYYQVNGAYTTTLPAGTIQSGLNIINPNTGQVVGKALAPGSALYGQAVASLGTAGSSGSTTSTPGTTSTTTNYGNALTSPLLQAPSSNLSEAALQATPGYQFNLNQGEESVANSAAARGLAGSGAALKGAANYATGLADSTYQNQFNNAVTNQTNQFNRLQSIASSGQNAAAGLGGIASSTANSIGANTVGAGNAAAAADNSIGSAIGGAANSVSSASILQQLLGGGGGLFGNGSQTDFSTGDF